tara:strand:- start:716 stop:1102 length:387 start_codon:yes stop_codon:yes gene_type:complete
MTKRSFKNIPIPKHVRESMQRSVKWQGGEMVIGVVYTDKSETALAWVGRDGGSTWAGGRLMRLMLQNENIEEDKRHRLRFLGTCLDETYGTGTRWDCGQVANYVNKKTDTKQYPVKLFIPDDQAQFKD